MDNRRTFLAAAGALLAACATKKDVEADAEPSRIGKPLKAYGERAPFEKIARLTPTTKQMENGATRTPLADLHGMTRLVLRELDARLATGPLSHSATVPFFHHYGGKMQRDTI